MFGAIMDAAMNIPKMMHAEEMQEDLQQNNATQANLDRSFNSAQAVAQREYDTAEVEKQRAWEERMSNTQWQRTSEDLSKAGFNRILSATKGPGAYHSSAAAASGAAHGSSGASGGSGTAQLQSKFTEAEINSAQEKLMRSQSVAADQLGWNYSADTEKKKQETNLLQEQTKTQEQLTNSARSQALILEADEKGRRLEGEIDETRYGNVMRYINRAMKAITGGSSAVENIRR